MFCRQQDTGVSLYPLQLRSLLYTGIASFVHFINPSHANGDLFKHYGKPFADLCNLESRIFLSGSCRLRFHRILAQEVRVVLKFLLDNVQTSDKLSVNP